MINVIWLLLLAAGVASAALHGNIELGVTKAILDSSQTAVDLALGMIGVMTFWLGLMKLAEVSGLTALVGRWLRPLLRLLFPSVPKGHPALGAIVMNFSANLLGLGNAATPMGIKAMEELQTLNQEPDTATDAMCTLLVLNTACITLVPTTVISLRAASGSANPAAIIGPTILATGVSLVVALIVDRLLRGRGRRRNR
ncbi:MAG: nucleoside recognition domain-containing protein [Bacillota bacterium]